jgi:hypothetical protein
MRGSKMREISVSQVTEQIADMCVEANYHLADDMKMYYMCRG